MELITNIINSKDNITDFEEKFPFFAWECITIEFKDRNIDLVIKNELHMQILIRYLIILLNSFDSNKNSLDFLKN